MKTVGKKFLHLVVVVLAVTFITFLMVDLLPGDAAYRIAGEHGTPDHVQALQKELGLTGNLVHRYFRWLSRAATGDLGASFITREPVAGAIAARLPVTIELMLMAQIMSITLTVPCAILCAFRPQSAIDKMLTGAAFAAMSIPVFVMALVLIYLFAVQLHWLPATGHVPLRQNAWLNLRSFFLPSLSIALVEWVPMMRVLRSDMITTLQKDYILLARAKGLPAHRILFNHALRPSSFTLLTIFGLQVGHLIGGALIVETIFALPGVGRLLVNAIFNQDTNLIQGCIVFISVVYVVVNFLVDILYAIIDPRIHRGAANG